MQFEGIGASPGIAMGRALVLESHEPQIPEHLVPVSKRTEEIKRFRRAISSSRKDLIALRKKVKETLGKKFTYLFDAHLLVLEDHTLVDDTEALVRKKGMNAEQALKQVVNRLLDVFASIEDRYLSERGGDLEDIYRRVQGHLTGRRNYPDLALMKEDAIIVARTLTPSDTALLNTERVIGFITEMGGRTSHTAIIANALEIPAVVGLHQITSAVETGDLLVVDGERGTVLVNPDLAERETATEARTAYRERELEYLRTSDLPAVTTDGHTVKLRANIELAGEVDTAMQYGAAGIGLYRSEFLFLTRSPELPSEDDHFEIYRELADRVAPRPCIIRTLDLGGEKYFHEVLDRHESNPVLGMRAIRFCLQRLDIFRSQLRGIVRAAVGRSIQVMFPLISGVQELRQARQLLAETMDDLRREGREVPQELPVGIMVEVPSAAMVADLLAKEVDFFSIGTNDLIQYLLAIDRSNESVAYLYQPLHPAVLRMLKFVTETGHKAGISVSMCGEMASDPRFLPVLIGLGLRELSVNPTTLPAIRTAVRKTNAAAAQNLAERLLGAQTAEEVGKILRAGSWPIPLSGTPGASGPS
ncbi:MAG: phosphoenolpyruvate--protein phosphotransferase [Acidobacteriota bacterium]